MDLTGYRVVLASRSPRRRELLSRITKTFEVRPAGGEEDVGEKRPDLLVQMLSLQKAEEVYRRLVESPGHTAEMPSQGAGDAIQPADTRPLLVIGSDTVVVLEDRILGKPADEADAFRMLRLLSGRTHAVYTGVTLMTAEKTRTFFERTDVTVYPLSDEEIRAYIATGSPMDKAGAYGIQDDFSRHIRCICGDYTSVVGFPVGRVYQQIRKLGNGG
ncbi:MAG: septum formation protein Maf [Lachnospiraceae bacterium]|nr:septum formation protein Maf [Lachnospiraceae bacterium]